MRRCLVGASTTAASRVCPTSQELRNYTELGTDLEKPKHNEERQAKYTGIKQTTDLAWSVCVPSHLLSIPIIC